MPKLKYSSTVELGSILLNTSLSFLINLLPGNEHLKFPISKIILLIGGCIAVLVILKSLSQSLSPIPGRQNSWVGFLPLIGGVIFYSITSFLQLPAEFIPVVFYTSLSLFALGILLPSLLLLPKSWRRWLFWVFPAVLLSITIHFALKQRLISAIAFLFLTISSLLLPIIIRFINKLRKHSKVRLEPIVDQRMDSLAGSIIRQLEFLLWESTSRFKRKYYQNLIYKYRTYRTQGLKTAGAFTPDLEKVFVSLRVESKALGQMSAAIIQEQQLAGNLHIWHFLTKIRQQPAYKRIVVIGSPGSGKTTLLEHLTLTYAPILLG
ncbi:MAG: hypothetical protein F6K47_42765 [Symploca sp. SIO2E6]|nr:hypothetical protein [Symploca sp. SIO2E6]